MRRWNLFLLAGILTFATGSLSAASLTEFLFCGCDFSPCPTAPCRPFSGFFIGVNGGIATNMAETSMFSDVLNLQDVSQTYLAENNVYQLRALGEVFGGWGWQFCWLYLGGRIGVNFSKFDPQANLEAEILDTGVLNVQQNSLKTDLRTAEFTADFKPGIVFCNNTMFFGIFGAAFNKQHMHGRASFSTADLPGALSTAEVEVTRERSFAGFRGGAGIEHMFCSCLSINLMYVYTHYWELTETATVTNTVVADAGPTATFMTQAHKQVTSIGLTVYL